MTQFNHPSSLITVSNSYFFNNSADFGGGIDACHVSGTMEVIRTVFIANFAWTQWKVLIGSGAAIQMSGATGTIVNSRENLYLLNIIEYKGYFFSFKSF